MENPEVDISKVVDILVKAASPDVQQAAVRKCVLLKISAPLVLKRVYSITLADLQIFH